MRNLKDKHLGSLASLEGFQPRLRRREKSRPSLGVTTAPTSSVVLVMVVAASAGRGRAESNPARTATCPPPTLSATLPQYSGDR